MIKPRLLLVGNFLSSQTGTRSICEDLAERLAEIGFSLLSTSSQRLRASRMIDMAHTILSRRKDYEAAYIEVYSGLAFIWAEICASLLARIQRPFVLALHGGGLPDFFRKNPNRMRRLLSGAKKVVSPSWFIIKSLPAIKPQIQYMPNAVNLPRYPFRWRKQVEPRIVWLRAFHDIYNPEMAVNTLAEINKVIPNPTLTMIGPDKGDGSLQRTLKQVERLNLRSRVKLTGAILKTNVPSELSKGEIFINTTHFESFGISVMEAAACGLPIVSTRAGEIEFLWDDGVNALLVPTDDHHAMADAILRLMFEPGLAGCLSFNGRKNCDQFSWNYILPAWEQLFIKVVNND